MVERRYGGEALEGRPEGMRMGAGAGAEVLDEVVVVAVEWLIVEIWKDALVLVCEEWSEWDG